MRDEIRKKENGFEMMFFRVDIERICEEKSVLLDQIHEIVAVD